MAPIVLGYWDIRGLGQPIRLLLEYAGADYEEKLYVTGPAPTYDKTGWLGDKDKLGLDFPNLPYMIDGDVKLSQSQAILRYIARKHGLTGNTEEERIRVDLTVAEWEDFIGHVNQMCYSPDFEAGKDKYLATVLPTKLKRFSEFLGERPFFSGNNITFADFVMYESMDEHKVLLNPTCLDNYKNLVDFMSRIEKEERIAKFLASPKCIKYPFNNRMANLGG